jgi:hypothetical protein
VRLAARVKRLEAKIPPAPEGCDDCRGRLLFCLGQYVKHEDHYTCAACNRDLSGCKFIAIDLREIL